MLQLHSSLRSISGSIFRGLSSEPSKPVLILKVKKKVKRKKNVMLESNILHKTLFGPLVETSKERKKKRNELDKTNHQDYLKESNCLIPEEQVCNEILPDINSITIDSSKWNDKVPSTLNISEITHFPLYAKGEIRNEDITVDGGIQSINMFEGGYQKLPSVKKILDETQTLERKAILEKWRKNMIKKLGKKEFEKYQEILLHKGSLLHGCLDLALRQKLEPSPEQLVGIEDLWMSVSHVIPKISQVQVVESRVIHPYLYYQGAIDCLATYKNKTVLIEFKTSTKPKLTLQSTYDDPLQLIAYLGALNYDGNYSIPKVDGALLVVAYPNGLPAHAHLLTQEDCNFYWRLWCRRLARFWSMQSL